MGNIELLEPGYVGISQGENSLNVVCIDEEGDPCFFPVTVALAEAIEAWSWNMGDLPEDLPEGLVELLEQGVVPERELEDEEALVDLFFGHLTGAFH